MAFRVLLPLLGLLMTASVTEAFKPCRDALSRCCRNELVQVTDWKGFDKEVGTICKRLQDLCSFLPTSPRHDARGPSGLGLPRVELTTQVLQEHLTRSCP